LARGGALPRQTKPIDGGKCNAAAYLDPCLRSAAFGRNQNQLSADFADLRRFSEKEKRRSNAALGLLPSSLLFSS
jgi:hypothetical protein